MTVHKVERSGDDGEVCLATVPIDFDWAAGEPLYRDLARFVDEGGKRIVIVCRSDYICSLGLAVLLRIHSHATEVGGEVKLAELEPVVEDIVRKTKLDDVFAVYSSAQDAIAAY